MDKFKKYLKPLVILIYLLDDDEEITEMVREIFHENGLDNCKFFNKGKDLMENLSEDVHICVVDHFLNNGVTGFDVLEKVNEVNPDCKKIVMSGMDSKDLIIEYLNERGINKWITKDLHSNYRIKLVKCIKDVMPDIINRYDLMREAAKWKAELDKKHGVV